MLSLIVSELLCLLSSFFVLNAGPKPGRNYFSIFEGKLYFVTNNQKEVYKQMKANPNVAICGMYKGTWIRVSGVVEEDTRREARVAMMDANTASLSKMYTVDDNLMTVFKFVSGKGTVYSFTEAPVAYSL